MALPAAADACGDGSTTATAITTPVTYPYGSSGHRSRENCCHVEVETASGLIGHGITGIVPDMRAIAAIVNLTVAPAVMGMDALSHEAVWHKLYWMLTPQAERPKKFCMGAREFDPKQVGFTVPASGESSCETGQTLFSMTDSNGKPIKGNSVLGHSFEAPAEADKKTYPNSVIGRKLSEEERYDLIEYLKTL